MKITPAHTDPKSVRTAYWIGFRAVFIYITIGITLRYALIGLGVDLPLEPPDWSTTPLVRGILIYIALAVTIFWTTQRLPEE